MHIHRRGAYSLPNARVPPTYLGPNKVRQAPTEIQKEAKVLRKLPK